MGQEPELVTLLWQMGSNGLGSEVGLDCNPERSAPAPHPPLVVYVYQLHPKSSTTSQNSSMIWGPHIQMRESVGDLSHLTHGSEGENGYSLGEV